MSSIFFILDGWRRAVDKGIQWVEMIHAWNRRISTHQLYCTVVGIESVSEGEHGNCCLGKLYTCQQKRREQNYEAHQIYSQPRNTTQNHHRSFSNNSQLRKLRHAVTIEKQIQLQPISASYPKFRIKSYLN